MRINRVATLAFALVAVVPAATQTIRIAFTASTLTADSAGQVRKNRSAQKGAGGSANKGAKVHAFDTIAAHDSPVLAHIKGSCIIDRIWMTIDDRSPEMLRGLRIDIYWDGAAQPAVSAPLGDLFGGGAGDLTPMDTALVASPEGRSFLSYIPMPFRSVARVVVTNETDKRMNLIFWDVDYRQMKHVPDDALYFHAYWSRQHWCRQGPAWTWPAAAMTSSPMPSARRSLPPSPGKPTSRTT